RPRGVHRSVPRETPRGVRHRSEGVRHGAGRAARRHRGPRAVPRRQLCLRLVVEAQAHDAPQGRGRLRRRSQGAGSGSRSARSGAHRHLAAELRQWHGRAMPGHAPAERPIPRGPQSGGPAGSRSGHSDVVPATPTRTDVLSLAALVDLQRLAGNAAVASALEHPTVQRDDAESKGGTPPPSANSIDVVFVIQRPGDQYTKDLNDYVKSTLKGDVFVAVANLQEICEQASKLTAGGKKLRKIRFASH